MAFLSQSEKKLRMCQKQERIMRPKDMLKMLCGLMVLQFKYNQILSLALKPMLKFSSLSLRK
jgi:hypothetical protein